MAGQTPDAITSYVDTITGSLVSLLGPDLAAVYLSGSAALGDFEPATSDVDLIALARSEPSLVVREHVVRSIDALTCPARGLEFVMYPLAAVAAGAASYRWSINLNLGPRLPQTVWWFDPGAVIEYWVTLDLAMVREHGQAIVGPPPAYLIGPIDRPSVLRALRRSLEWHARFDRGRPNRVLNACRAWHYLDVGDLVSKATAAEWAERRTRNPLIAQAVRLRAAGELELDPDAVDAFVEHIEAAIRAAATDPPPTRPAPASEA